MHLFDPGNLLRIFNNYTRNRVVVFMMHRFRDPSIGFLNSYKSHSQDTLENCFKYLIDNNYNILSFKDLVISAQKNKTLHKTVCFTIDDGYVDFKNVAFPVFKKYNIPATVFITTGFIEEKMMMWWDQLEYIVSNTIHDKVYFFNKNTLTLNIQSQEEKKVAIKIISEKMKLLSLPEIFSHLQRLSEQLNVTLPDEAPRQYSALRWADIRKMERYGIDFQPHTVNHPILSRIELAEQEWQIKVSAETIRERINSNPIVFCYPNGSLGDYTEDTIAILKRESFIGACSTERGFFNPASTDLFNIPRFAFPKQFYKFILYVSGCRFWQLNIKEKFKRAFNSQAASRQPFTINNGKRLTFAE